LTVGYEVSGDGVLLRTSDAGRSWQSLGWSHPGKQVDWIYFQSRADGWAAFETGPNEDLLAMTSDGGRSWRNLGTDFDPRWAAAIGQGDTEEQLRLSNHGWSLSVDGLRVKAHHQLAHWKNPIAATRQPGGWIWVAGSLEGFTPKGCGDCGPAVWLGHSNGAAWQYRSSDGAPQITAIGFTTHRRGWLIAGGTIYTTQDGGRDWSPIELTVSGPGLSSGS
jgi:photosystem II stability/assembly factor-like uncharacterized protein